MTLPRHTEEALHASWNEVAAGAPSIIGFALLASRAIANDTEPVDVQTLSLEAQAILFAARERGCIELKAVPTAFESAERLLAVHVELSRERMLIFRNPTRPQFTMALLAGFRELCAVGYAMHQTGHDFSLTHAGFLAAAAIDRAEVDPILAQAVDLDFAE